MARPEPQTALDRTDGARLFIRYVILVAVAFLVLFPIYVTVLFAFKKGDTIFNYDDVFPFIWSPRALLPVDLTFQTLREAWNQGDLGRYLFNSGIQSVAITVGQLVTSLLAAYAFAFMRFPFKNAIFALFLATLLVPAEVTILANTDTIKSLGWVDTYQGLVVPFLATAFGTFLLRQVFRTVPKDLSEAAALDGLGHFGFLREVAAPLARPTLGALALFSFLAAWNQYLWPQRITNDPDRRTVQIGLKALASANPDQLNLVTAGTVIAAVPIVIVLIIFQRQLIRGLSAGAVKG
jgi:sn-glycerol 3-phosphate transport system permease protein